MDLTLKLKGAEEALKVLDARLVQRAAAAAVGRVKDQVKTDAVRRMVKKYNIKQGDLLNKGSGAERVRVTSFSRDGLTATISFSGGGISLAYFGATDYRLVNGRLMKQTRIKGEEAKHKERNKRGVEVSIIRGGKKAALHAFMSGVGYGGSKQKGTAHTGYHLGIFRRQLGNPRYESTGNIKIYERNMISVASMIKKKDIFNPLEAFAQKKLDERFAHELKRLGFGGLS